jgi:ribosomal protein L29
VVNAYRVTSIADTDIDAVRKQKKAEYNKQYRLKRKLLLRLRSHIYMSHVNKVQPIRVKMIRIAAIRVTCI